MELLFIFNFVFIALIEVIISSKWYPGYFQVGIPLYSKTYRFKGTANVPIGEVALNEAFKKGLTSTFVFKEIEPNIFTFRERLFEFKLISYTPLMHGRLEINQMTREIRIIGLLNWWIVMDSAQCTNLKYFVTGVFNSTERNSSYRLGNKAHVLVRNNYLL